MSRFFMEKEIFETGFVFEKIVSKYIVEKANYFRNFSNNLRKYSGKGAVNSIYSPVAG